MQYQYCPKCGYHYAHRQADVHALKCDNCGFTFYLNSKPTASVLVVQNDKLLLGKRRIEPSKGKWDVIGGFLNFGEDPVDGAKREVEEETGLKIIPKSIIGIFMDIYGPDGDATLNICYLGEVIGGDLKANDDIESLQWFAKDEIPNEIAFQNGRDMIDVWMKSSI